MAKKDAYYFSHDANARNDVKCLRLRREMGLEGYGIFWCLIEMLREEENHKLPVTLIEDIAFNLHTSKEKVEAVIKRYELFDFDEFSFFSSRLIRSMVEYKQLKNKLSEAGRKGGYGKAMAGLKQPSGIKGKESKEKEIKENEILVPQIGGLNDSEKKFPIDHCALIASNDQTWVHNSGFSGKLKDEFLKHLKGSGETEKNPADFKKHFWNWKTKQPDKKPLKLVYK